MSEEEDVRPSKMPAFEKCPSYCMKPSAPSNVAGIPATIGQAIHAIFEKYTTNGEEITFDVLKKYASKYGVEVDGYMGLSRKCYKLDEKYRENAVQYFPNPEREKFMAYTMANGFKLKGTADLVQVHSDFGVVLDLKTGESEMMDNMPQIKTYALMLWRMSRHLGVHEVYGFVFNPVIDKYQIAVWTGAELEEYETFLMDQMTKIGKVFNEGSHCTWCPNLTSCPKHLNSCKALLADSGLLNLIPEQIGEIRPKIIHLKQLIKEYDEFEKNLVEAQGIIDLGDGTEIYLKERSAKKFDTATVINKIYEYRDDQINLVDYLGKHLKISTTAIKGIIGDTAGKGMKGKDQVEFMELLAQANAITEAVSMVKTVRSCA